MHTLYPVILCGGSGTRLWPLSRALYPKQFMDINGHTLFGHTLERCRPLSDTPIVVCNEAHRFYVAAALQEHGMQGHILLEPVGRNTAPAIALAALQALEHDPDACLLALPSDHKVQPPDALLAAVREALPAAHAGRLITFGITPTEPATGFGYIVAGEHMPQYRCHAVLRFQEKPDARTAQELLDAGNCYWNSGMFLFQAKTYLEELRQWAPDIHAAVSQSWANRQRDRDFLRPGEAQFTACPADSIDYAVMEHTQKAAVMPLQLEWSDLGSWDAFYEVMPKDEAGNACLGEVLLQDSRDCYAHSTHRLIAGLGLDRMIIVETADAVLVARRDAGQQVKDIVATLKKQRRPEFELHPIVYRPWGSFEGLARHERFQVKRIIVKPGAELSLQKHHHRAEHWVVVGGTAEVTVGDKVMLCTENESVYIPVGVLHRLKNPGLLPLIIVEVQTGGYLGEDDIVRVEDTYGRTRDDLAAGRNATAEKSGRAASKQIRDDAPAGRNAPSAGGGQ